VATVYPLALGGAARPALLIKDAEAARKGYTDFLVAWKDADPDLRVFRDARLERERVGGAELASAPVRVR
jgi:hypothetical protein